jgi:hypothetical protein
VRSAFPDVLLQGAALFLLIFSTPLCHEVGQHLHLPDQLSGRLRYRFNDDPVAEPGYFQCNVRTVMSDFGRDPDCLRIAMFKRPGLHRLSPLKAQEQSDPQWWKRGDIHLSMRISMQGSVRSMAD